MSLLHHLKTAVISVTSLALLSFSFSFAYADGLISAASPDARLYFIEPADGAIIQGDVTIKFGLSGMGVAPAGINVDNTGHHHLLIDTDQLPNMSQSLPATDQLKHFGKGQTETTLTLSLGQHTLQLLLGNYVHIPHDKPVLSEKITITVVENTP